MKHTSQFLKTARKKTGIEAKVMAKRLKFSAPQSIYDWENGIKPVPLKSIPRIAKAYGVSKSILINHFRKDMVSTLDQRLKKIYAAKV